MEKRARGRRLTSRVGVDIVISREITTQNPRDKLGEVHSHDFAADAVTNL